MTKTLAGERNAFRPIYDAYADRLFRGVLWRYLGDPTLAEDALADTFRTAFERLHTFEFRGESIYAWLVVIARNRAMDVLRGRSRRAELLRTVAGMLASDESSVGSAVSEDSARVLAEVHETLGTVHERYALAIRLRLFEERSRAECAQALGTSVATFDVVFLRAVRAFRRAWDERRAGDAARAPEGKGEDR
ncbi:MAG: sigma-70 family RNA polymerase sigma factor [Polyangiales bacterium]